MGVVDLKELFVLERWRKLHGDCPIPPRLAVWPDGKEVAKEGFVKNKSQDDYWCRFPDPARVTLLRWQVRQAEEKLQACAEPLELCKRAVASSRSAFEEHRTAYEAHCSTMSAMRDLMANGGLCFPGAEGLEDGSLTVVPKRCIGRARCFFCRERAQLEADERQEDPFLADMSSCSEHPLAAGLAAPWRSKAKAVSSTSRPENEEEPMVVHQPGPGFLRSREPGQESSGPGHEEVDYRARSTSRERQLRKPYRLRGSTAYKRKAQEAVVAKSLPEEETWFEKHTEDPGAGGALKVDSPEDFKAVFESAANKFKADWLEAVAEGSMRSPLEVGVEDGVEGATASPVSRKTSMAADRVTSKEAAAAAPFTTLFARAAVTQPASRGARASSSGQIPSSSHPSASSQGSNAEDRQRRDTVTQPSTGGVAADHPSVGGVAAVTCKASSGSEASQRFSASFMEERVAAPASGDDRRAPHPEMRESKADFEEGRASAAARAPTARDGWSSESGDLASKAKAALAGVVRSHASSSGASSRGSRGSSKAKQQSGSSGATPAAFAPAVEAEQADASVTTSRVPTLVDRRWSRVAAVAACSAAHQLLLSELCFVEWRRAHDRRKRAVAAAVWQPMMQADHGSRADSRRQSIASSVSAGQTRKQQSSRASQAAQSGSEREGAWTVDRSWEDAHAGPGVQTDARRHSLASSGASAGRMQHSDSRPSPAGQSAGHAAISGSERDIPQLQVQQLLEDSIQEVDASPGSRASSRNQSLASSASAGRMRMQHSSRPSQPAQSGSERDFSQLAGRSVQDADVGPPSQPVSRRQSIASSASAAQVRMQHSSRSSQPAQSGSERDVSQLAMRSVQDADVGPPSQPESRRQSIASSASAAQMRMQQSGRQSQASHSGSERGFAQAARQALQGADASPSSPADSIRQSLASSGSAGRMRTHQSSKTSQAAQSGSEREAAQAVEQVVQDADVGSPGSRASSGCQSVASSSSAGRMRMQQSSQPDQVAQSNSEQEHVKRKDQASQEADASPGSRASSHRHSQASSASAGRMRHVSSRASHTAQSSSEKDSRSPDTAGGALAEPSVTDLTDADASSSAGHGRQRTAGRAAASTPVPSASGSETSRGAARRVDQSLEESRSSVGQAEVEPVVIPELADTETSSPSVDQRRSSASGIVASPGGDTSTPGPSVSDSEARARPLVQLEVQSLEESRSQADDSLSEIAALELAGQEAAHSIDRQSSADDIPAVSGGAVRSPATLSLASGSRHSSQPAQRQESHSQREAVSSDEERCRNFQDSVVSSPAMDQQRGDPIRPDVGQPVAGEASPVVLTASESEASPEPAQLDQSLEDTRDSELIGAEPASSPDHHRHSTGESSRAPSASESAASSPQPPQLGGDDSFEDALPAGEGEAHAEAAPPSIAAESPAAEADTDAPPAGAAMAASKKRELLERLRQRRAQGVRGLAAPQVLANPASTTTDATTETVTSVASAKEALPLQIATDLNETTEQEDDAIASSSAMQPEGPQRAASSSSVSATARPVTPLTSSDTLTCSATDASPLRPPANRARADSSAARTAGGESSSAAASASPAMVRRMTESSINEDDTVSEIRVQPFSPGAGDRSSAMSESPSSIDGAESSRSRTGQATGVQGTGGTNAAQTSPSSPSSSSGSDSFG